MIFGYHGEKGIDNLRIKLRVLVGISTMVAAFLSGAVIVEASQTWNVCSNYDSEDATTSSLYNINTICASQYSEDPDEISFFLNFNTYVSATQFNTIYGSYAGVTIDTNYDGEFELAIFTSKQNLNYDRTPIAGRIIKNSQTLSCQVDVWSDLSNLAKWVGFAVNKTCAGLNGAGFSIQGFADSKYSTSFGFDFAPSSAFYIGPPNNSVTVATTVVATTTSTTTTTTLPKVQVPNAPSSISISKLSDTALRLTWLDNSTNEDGFLIQRNDLPVPAGTTSAAWPYKTGVNTATMDFGDLAANRSYCFAIASYNSAGSSSFTDSACFILTSAAGVSQSTVLANSLACDATRVSSAAKLVQIVVDAGKANAGKMLKFEVFKAGKWSLLGSARVTSAGATALSAKTSLVGEKGRLPIRATQGSRFVCEGNLN